MNIAVRANSAFITLPDQVKDFMLTTGILPYEKPQGPIKALRNPGEGLHQTQLLDVLSALKYGDKLLLLVHIVLNDMFGIKEISMYDWGYWINESGEIQLLPYGFNFNADRSLINNYTICGVSPTISMLGWCYNDDCFAHVRDRMLHLIVQYEDTIAQKAVTDPVKWSAFYRVLQNTACELMKCVR